MAGGVLMRAQQTGGKRRGRTAAVALATVLALVTALFVTFAEQREAHAAPGAPFTNPLKAERGSDPWIQYHDGNYYMTSTSWASDISIRRAPTLAGLARAQDRQVWNGRADDPSRCCNIWAPEFHRVGDRWYLYYTAGQDSTEFTSQRSWVLESEGSDPMGPYHFKARLSTPGMSGWLIDGSIMTIGGTRYYMASAWAGDFQNLYIARMSNPYTITGEFQLLSTPEHAWERSGGNVNEGAEVLQRNGRTFVTYSASGCWTPDYKLGMLTYNGGDPLNRANWTKGGRPVFERNDAAGVYGPGHNGFFKSPDGTEDWIVYHANDAASDGCDTGRSARAQKVEWNADGTPNFGRPVGLGVQLPGPSGEPTG